MFKRLKILFFWFFLSHSNSLFHSKKQDKNSIFSTASPAIQNPFTTELHKIIRWKSQPSLYKSMEYQDMVGAPLAEEIMTEKSTTRLQNLTAQPWIPIFRNSTARPSSVTTGIFWELPYQPEENDYEHDILERKRKINVETSTFKAIIKEKSKDICPHFVLTKQVFDLELMADVWQTVYFSLPNKIQCFKIVIKRITEKEKIQYSKKFGNFNGVVDWAECNLEISPGIKSGRKHFLQGINEDDGVMDNIIIEDLEGTNTDTHAVLHEESADQWLVHKKLLLLRDCDNGGIVVFTKVPSKPSRTDIQKALEVFGETIFNGHMACEEDEDVSTVKFYDYDDDTNNLF